MYEAQITNSVTHKLEGVQIATNTLTVKLLVH